MDQVTISKSLSPSGPRPADLEPLGVGALGLAVSHEPGTMVRVGFVKGTPGVRPCSGGQALHATDQGQALHVTWPLNSVRLGHCVRGSWPGDRGSVGVGEGSGSLVHGAWGGMLGSWLGGLTKRYEHY